MEGSKVAGCFDVPYSLRFLKYQSDCVVVVVLVVVHLNRCCSGRAPWGVPATSMRPSTSHTGGGDAMSGLPDIASILRWVWRTFRGTIPHLKHDPLCLDGYSLQAVGGKKTQDGKT